MLKILVDIKKGISNKQVLTSPLLHTPPPAGKPFPFAYYSSALVRLAEGLNGGAGSGMSLL